MKNLILSAVDVMIRFFLLVGACSGQTVADLQNLAVPQKLELSANGTQVWYHLENSWWRVHLNSGTEALRVEDHRPAEAETLTGIQGTSRLLNPRRSPDGKRIAYLDAETAYGPLLLFCQHAELNIDTKTAPLSRMPILTFQWASDSDSLWVIAASGADEAIGRMSLDGHFSPVTQSAAMRSLDGLAAASDVLAWVQSDGSHHGAIWVRSRAGESRLLVDPNPQTSTWSAGWTQEVVRWRNAHGEELQGVLIRPVNGSHLPMIVDPYSTRRNRFLSAPVLGNYAFVKAGFAIFQPDHRAPHVFSEMAFGAAYVGTSKERDPVDVLTGDVMSGVANLIHKGIADPKNMFLYSASNGASAIDQLLTRTHAFSAAVSGGVADWLGYYEMRHKLGDETIPGFLGGRTPQDSLAFYKEISPLYQARKITTPLLLIIGDQDTRYRDTMRFYDVLKRLHRPVYLVVYHGEGHELSDRSREQEHVQRSLDFFRSVSAGKKPSD